MDDQPLRPLTWTDFSAIIENFLGLGCTGAELQAALIATQKRDTWDEWVQDVGLNPALDLLQEAVAAHWSDETLRTALYEEFIAGWDVWRDDDWPPVVDHTPGV